MDDDGAATGRGQGPRGRGVLISLGEAILSSSPEHPYFHLNSPAPPSRPRPPRHKRWAEEHWSSGRLETRADDESLDTEDEIQAGKTVGGIGSGANHAPHPPIILLADIFERFPSGRIIVEKTCVGGLWGTRTKSP